MELFPELEHASGRVHVSGAGHTGIESTAPTTVPAVVYILQLAGLDGRSWAVPALTKSRVTFECGVSGDVVGRAAVTLAPERVHVVLADPRRSAVIGDCWVRKAVKGLHGDCSDTCCTDSQYLPTNPLLQLQV